MPILEKDIKRHIMEYLRFRGDCFAWVNHSTGIWDPLKGRFRKLNQTGAIRGVSDILGVIHGIPLAIEVKTPTGKISFHQKIFLDTFTAAGGIGIVARSVDELIKQLPKINRSWKIDGNAKAKNLDMLQKLQ